MKSMVMRIVRMKLCIIKIKILISEDKDCAICLCEKVDTMIIPCKHMCLCKACS